MQAIFPVFYAPNIQYFTRVIRYSSVLLEYHEHYRKQTYRSRCYIKTDQGKLALIIPVIRKNRQPIHLVRIDNSVRWQTRHRRSLETSYRNSPYFEFYEDLFQPLYSGKYDFLCSFNADLLRKCIACLGINTGTSFTLNYREEYDIPDYRKMFLDKDDRTDEAFLPKTYLQVFPGFMPNLSILDLLFCKGREARDVLLASLQSNTTAEHG